MGEPAIDLANGRILITGGAGFIGSALLWHLNQRGLTNILVADFLGKDEKWKNLAPLEFADYLEADELQQRVVETPHQLNDVTTIFHLGACTSTTESDAAYLIRNNFEYTKTLAHFALEGGRRFVYASSAATYGSMAEGVSEDVPLTSLRPLNMYGYSKHLFDCYAARSGMLPRVIGLKYFNVFGPNENHKGEMRSVAQKAFEQIGRTGTVSLFKSYKAEYPDGGQQRDFLYVKDAVAATVHLAEQRQASGLFNIGSGEPRSWLSLAEAIFAALGREPKIEFIDMPEYLREKYQYYTCANISKLRAAGFSRVLTCLPDAIADYVKNYLAPDVRLGDEGSVSGRC
jgi:ADP-L-glycero-D-manno-heptose 6-epimerase